MEVGVGHAARYLQVSERRLRKLIADGVIPARQVGGRWLIDEVVLNRAAPISRPMSDRIAWAMLVSLEGGQPAGLRADERHRLAHKVERLRSSDQSLSLLRSWLAARAERIGYTSAPADIADLLRDPRLVPSGISDPRAGLSSASEAEAYVRRNDVDGVVADYLLVKGDRPNVWLHISDHEIPRPVPLGLVIADLADANQPRESQAAQSLLNDVLR